MQNVTMQLHSSGYLYHTGKDGGFGLMIPANVDTLTFLREGYEKEKRPIHAGVFNEIILKKTVVVKTPVPSKLSSLVQKTPGNEERWHTAGNETYAALVENEFVPAVSKPTTAITLNVDRASYSNIRRFLNLSSVVPTDAVRIEEMLNYFNFYYTEPKDNATFEIGTTLTACPWNKNNALLFAQVNSKKIDLDLVPQSHLVFLVDVSGSMDFPNRLLLLKSGFKALVNHLRPTDTVSVVVYGGSVGVALLPPSGSEKTKILNTIDNLQPSGSTPGESGIKLAYSLARAHFIQGGNNRVILATDGDFNVGIKREEELEEMIEKERKNGIYLTCLGVGMGNYKDSKIQTLAQRGNGNFAYLDSYLEMEKVLLKEFMQTLHTVADDASLTVRFDPAWVKEYRVIGFDNKVSALNDTAATLLGGEIGPGYSMLAAFELVLAKAFKGEAIDPVQFTLQYKKPSEGMQSEIADRPKLRFTPFNSLAPSDKFATAVVLFGSLLRNSKFVNDASWNEVLSLARPAVNPNNYSQVEFLRLVEQAKRLYSGKKRKKEE